MPRPIRRRRVADVRALQDRREELLDAALRIIDRDGFEALNIETIAKEAGVGQPFVYRSYDGFGALLLALIDRQQRRSMNQLYAALDLDAPERDDLAAVMERAAPALHRMVLDDPVLWRAMLCPGPHVPDAVLDRIAADREQLRSVFEQLLTARAEKEQAEREGAGRETSGGSDEDGGAVIDPEVLSHALVAALEQLGRLVLADPERYDEPRLLHTVRVLFGRPASPW
ncbi:TetR/AcrR family transcriptional regulator [Nocardioides sp. zg-536]|uniref:TetR/AcrR family transcriptional regulator n=1 Tax=Nocardioides faecalis TaxID=2803858 RepID=A0A938Y689_9ACTN|nr:TetR/AcrR family transcriptional regulator [Nocardioides faecalis]MBM9460025.1 TetR/AcrR family transcriptional regulator [Nocardioides faecalis]MBS4753107.1 TetR/AcrR family transcriptional regulator [Nocardioides faecalis]QVI58755.1 TetR/AcrR family transcriptional regulator [Nocardioides faecalis]